MKESICSRHRRKVIEVDNSDNLQDNGKIIVGQIINLVNELLTFLTRINATMGPRTGVIMVLVMSTAVRKIADPGVINVMKDPRTGVIINATIDPRTGVIISEMIDTNKVTEMTVVDRFRVAKIVLNKDGAPMLGMIAIVIVVQEEIIVMKIVVDDFLFRKLHGQLRSVPTCCCTHYSFIELNLLRNVFQ